MAETLHPTILRCQMQGGVAGINIDSIYKIIPDYSKPKTRSAVYMEGADDGLVVDEVCEELIKRWSEGLFFREAIDAGYFEADSDDEDAS